MRNNLRVTPHWNDLLHLLTSEQNNSTRIVLMEMDTQGNGYYTKPVDTRGIILTVEKFFSHGLDPEVFICFDISKGKKKVKGTRPGFPVAVVAGLGQNQRCFSQLLTVFKELGQSHNPHQSRHNARCPPWPEKAHGTVVTT